MFEQPYHLLAYYTAALAANASNVSLNTVTDQQWTFDTTGYFMPDNLKLWSVYAANDDLVSLRVNQPSLREPFLPYVEPFSLTLAPANTPPVAKMFESGVDLRINEFLRLDASKGAALAAPATALAWVGRTRRAIPPGPRRTARFASSVTVAAGTWSLGNFTFADTLPDGKFAIVGLSVYGGNVLAARLAFTGGGWRPGTLAQQVQGEWTPPAFARDELGFMGTFLNTIQPNIEYFGLGAGTSQIGYMDLVQVR